jgi:hypothetical protein
MDFIFHLVGGWQALFLQSRDIIVSQQSATTKPLVEVIAAPAGLHHQWVGDVSDIGSLGVTGYGTMAPARWHRY